jgi:hypothetical protein
MKWKWATPPYFHMDLPTILGMWMRDGNLSDMQDNPLYLDLLLLCVSSMYLKQHSNKHIYTIATTWYYLFSYSWHYTWDNCMSDCDHERRSKSNSWWHSWNCASLSWLCAILFFTNICSISVCQWVLRLLSAGQKAHHQGKALKYLFVTVKDRLPESHHYWWRVMVLTLWTGN